MIPLFRPDLGNDEIREVSRVLRSGWIGKGPETAAFEKEFARFSGSRHAVGLNSCTAALELALRVLGIGPGHDVLVPTLTFCSDGHAPLFLGARPVFCDCDPETLLTGERQFWPKMTGQAEALIVVHFGGVPVPMAQLLCFAADRRLAVVEDCAHACGTEGVGRAGDIACWSFHAVKNLACGDGGMLTTNVDEYAQRVRWLSWLGIDKATAARTTKTRYVSEYEIKEIGEKCHMNDIAAAIGRVQLARLSEMNAVRRHIAERYHAELRGVRLPVWRDGVSWHLYIIRHPKRDRLRAYLNARDICTGMHYRPLHTFKCYGKQPRLQHAEAAAKEIVSLPMFPTMTDDQVSAVVKAVNAFTRKEGKA